VRRKWCALMLIALLAASRLIIPDDTVHLARTLYALGGGGTEEEMLVIGSVLVNRLAHPQYPDTLREILIQEDKPLRGMIYDKHSMHAARALLMGTRALPPDIVALDTVQPEMGRSPEAMTDISE